MPLRERHFIALLMSTLASTERERVRLLRPGPLVRNTIHPQHLRRIPQTSYRDPKAVMPLQRQFPRPATEATERYDGSLQEQSERGLVPTASEISDDPRGARQCGPRASVRSSPVEITGSRVGAQAASENAPRRWWTCRQTGH